MDKNNIKFETWLKKQQHRDDAIGDLACDFVRSLKINPKLKNIEESMSKWGACEGAVDALNLAKQEFCFLACDVCSSTF